MKAQDAEALEFVAGGKTASMMVAMVKKRQLARLPPIMAQRRPILSMEAMQTICAMRARTEEIPWYWKVRDLEMPICGELFVSYGLGLRCCGICLYLAKDDGTVILNGADTSHLDGGLDRTGEQETTERALVSEQVKVRLGLVFVLVSDRLTDLVVLGNNPCIGLISVSVEFCQSAKTLFVLSVVDEPSARVSMCWSRQVRYCN